MYLLCSKLKYDFIIKDLISMWITARNMFQVSTDEDAESGSRWTSRRAATELRAKHEDLFAEGNWNHLCVVLNKSVVRKSTASIYVNGVCVVSTTKVLQLYRASLHLIFMCKHSAGIINVLIAIKAY